MSKMTDRLNGSCLYCSDGNLQHIPTIQYFEDVFPQMQNLDFDGESSTDAIYNDEWAPQRYSLGETGALYDLDFGCFYGCPNGTLFLEFAVLIPDLAVIDRNELLQRRATYTPSSVTERSGG